MVENPPHFGQEKNVNRKSAKFQSIQFHRWFEVGFELLRLDHHSIIIGA